MAEPPKWRFILNATYLNPYVPRYRCRLPSIDDIISAMTKGSFWLSIDLSAAYSQIPIDPESSRYLCLAWPDSKGVTRYYAFRTLPFGLRSAVFVFQSFLKPVQTYFSRFFQ